MASPQGQSTPLRPALGEPTGTPESDRPRICLVTTEFQGLFKNGGIGTATTGLALTLGKADFDVTVAFANADETGPRVKDGNFAQQKEECRALGITLDFIPPHPLAPGAFDDPRSASYSVYAFLQAHQFDVVVFNDCGGQGYYSLLAKHTGAFQNPPFMVVVAHGPHEWVHELNSLSYYDRRPVIVNFLERRCASLADVLVSPSRYLRDWMMSRGWTLPGEVRVIQNIVPTAGAQADPVEADEPRRVTEIVFFGRLEVRKGLEMFCDAIDSLDRAFDMKTVRIVFMGKFSQVAGLHSGVYIVERSQRWRSRVRIIARYGQREALDYLGKAGSLAVMPSLAENSPCVVVECLLLGLPFIATRSGGTTELLSAQDGDHCLVEPDAAALAAKLAAVLAFGQKPARLAISQAESAAAWLRLFAQDARDGAASVTQAPRPGRAPARRPERPETAKVSICFVYQRGDAAVLACFRSLLVQTYPNIEILAVGYGPAGGQDRLRQAALEQASGSAAIRFHAEGLRDRGAARNAAAAQAEGDYLLFVNEEEVILQPECVATFVLAASRTQASLVTGVPLQFDRRGIPMAGWDGQLGYFPIGACTELGAFENCFGEANILVDRQVFAALGGYPAGRGLAVDDWQFLATAVLAGYRLDVVPRCVFWQRLFRRRDLGRADRMANHRRILRAFEHQQLAAFAHIVEGLLHINRQEAALLPQMLADVPKRARDLATALSMAHEPNDMACVRGLIDFWIARGRVQEALEFAEDLDPALVPQTLEAATAAAEAAALSAIRAAPQDHRPVVDLTAEVGPRLRTTSGPNADPMLHPPGTLVAYRARLDPTILKAAAVCPPRTRSMTATVSLAAPHGHAILVALAACKPEARLGLAGDDVTTDDGSWWSGWTRVPSGTSPTDVTVHLPDPAEQVLDLFVISRAEAVAAPASVVTWLGVTATLSLTGPVTQSRLDLVSTRSPLPRIVLDRAEVLSDTSGFPFPVFVPGKPTLHHPLPGKATLVRLPQALFPGARGIRCVCSVDHADAHPVQFALWARPSSQPVTGEAELLETDPFSGWLTAREAFHHHELVLMLRPGTDQPMDLYLATRVTDYGDVYYCHAVWHEIVVMEA